jgi:hypothetical protein
LGGLGIQTFGIFHGNLLYYVVFWYMLWPFGIFCDGSGYFFLFWYSVPRKIWQPWTTYFLHRRQSLRDT